MSEHPPLSPEALGDIRRRAEQASPGPWRLDMTTLSWYLFPAAGPWICTGFLPYHTWRLDPEETLKTQQALDGAHLTGLDPETVLRLVQEIETARLLKPDTDRTAEENFKTAEAWVEFARVARDKGVAEERERCALRIQDDVRRGYELADVLRSGR